MMKKLPFSNSFSQLTNNKMENTSLVNRVELRNIAKSFGGVAALKDVTLKALPGEIHALMGENGAGKSTLMKILSRSAPKR